MIFFIVSWTFCHYVVKLWILFKSFVLAGLPDASLVKVWGYGKVGVKVQVPHLVSIDNCGDISASLLLGRDGSLLTGPLLTLPWVGGRGCFIIFFPGGLHLNHRT